MARLIKRNKKTRETEEQFLSLVFPMKKKWVVARPEVRARKSVLKKRLSLAASGKENQKI